MFCEYFVTFFLFFRQRGLPGRTIRRRYGDSGNSTPKQWLGGHSFLDKNRKHVV